jgi:hypothetical protein
VGPELPQDVGHLVAHGLLTLAELNGNGAIVEATSEQTENLVLGRRQLGNRR